MMGRSKKKDVSGIGTPPNVPAGASFDQAKHIRMECLKLADKGGKPYQEVIGDAKVYEKWVNGDE